MNATNPQTHFAMSVFLLAMVLMLCAGMARGQAEGQVQEEWVIRHNGQGNEMDIAHDIAVDGAGNIYVTGTSRAGHGDPSTDCATIKYDPAGNELWVAYFDGSENQSGFDKGQAIAVDSLGNVYVTGGSSISGSSANQDYATIKYDSAGNQLWVAYYIGAGYGSDVAQDIALDSSGNVYVTGNCDGTIWSSTYATVKYDAAGNQLWVARYNGPGNSRDYAYEIAVDASGNVYVTGSSTGSGTSMDYATIKYDTNGNELWLRRYNGPGNDSDQANAMALDASGNVYVTGSSYGSGTGTDYTTVKYSQASLQVGDFVCPDGITIDDFVFFIEHWRDDNCDLSNDYCQGTDLDFSGTVDEADLEILIENWLAVGNDYPQDALRQ